MPLAWGRGKGGTGTQVALVAGCGQMKCDEAKGAAAARAALTLKAWAPIQSICVFLCGVTFFFARYQ